MQVQTVAAQLVDLLALKVPAKHVLPEVLAFAGTAITAPDVRQRHAAVAVLGIVSEAGRRSIRTPRHIFAQLEAWTE